MRVVSVLIAELLLDCVADPCVAVFPGLVESIDIEDWTNAKRWVDIIEGRILTAANEL